MLQRRVEARQRKPSDFSDEYVGKQVVLKLCNGSSIEGILVEARRFWFKVRDRGLSIIYVNKGFVESVEIKE